MFRPNRPSSGVRVVTVKDSAAHCNAVFFPPVVVASGYFGYVCYHQFCNDNLAVSPSINFMLIERYLNHHRIGKAISVTGREGT
jgi:hypothetical protein